MGEDGWKDTMNPKYMVVSGYHEFPNTGLGWFHDLWWDTLHRYAKPERVFIVSSGGCKPPNPKGDWIYLTGDLGGCGALLSGEKPYFTTGCAAVWMIGAWLAYANEMDLIIVEQDCLSFGHWPEVLYSEIGDKGAIFGKCKTFPASNSLFLVRHRFLPYFVYHFTEQGPENTVQRLSECKFANMVKAYPNDYAWFSFGYDRDRPFNVTDAVFTVQKLARPELILLRDAGLIDLKGMPGEVNVFSNHANI
jgi:hypothetical protein